MPRSKKTTVKRTVKEAAIKNAVQEQSLLQQLQEQLKIDQSYLSLVLGLLIVLIAGILVFNYFKTSKPSLGPSDQISEAQADVSPENLPGKYTVKKDDTLFLIAQKYYSDGYKYTEIVKANDITDANTIEEGQVLEIPKLETAVAEATATPTVTPSSDEKGADLGTGGAENQTIWGERINGETYTVVTGDWLSTIAGRAYGDIMQFNKIAEANNIADPNAIEVGTVLKLPR